jgi:hypothetical protein
LTYGGKIRALAASFWFGKTSEDESKSLMLPLHQKRSEYTGNRPNIPAIELYFVNKVKIFHFFQENRCALLKILLVRSAECFGGFTQPNGSFTHHGEWSSGIPHLWTDKLLILINTGHIVTPNSDVMFLGTTWWRRDGTVIFLWWSCIHKEEAGYTFWHDQSEITLQNMTSLQPWLQKWS